MLFIFDMGGVVTNTFLLTQLYNKLNITTEDFFKLCASGQEDIWNLFQTGKINPQQFWTQFNERVAASKDEKYSKVPVVENDLFRLYFHPSKNLETVELIQQLKKKHRVVCGTNTIDSHWENHMERGDYAFFNQTYASNKIGCAKPDPHFFELILEAEQTAPEDAFFTDDRADNVAAAASLGIHAELFTSAAELTAKWQQYC
jgi:putative hydrolase of the HAD superfamily